jgi:hypothetical protein
LCFCINMYFLQCFPVIYLDSVLYCSTMQLLICTLCCVCNWPYSCWLST